MRRLSPRLFWWPASARAQGTAPIGCDAAIAPGDIDPQPKGVHLIATQSVLQVATFCVVTNGSLSWLNAVVTLFSKADEIVGSNSWATRDTDPNSGESNPALLMPFSVTNTVGATYTDPTQLLPTVMIELQWCTTGFNYPDCAGAGHHTFRLPWVSDGTPARCPTTRHPHRRRRRHTSR